MALLELLFSSQQASLAVARFEVFEAMSQPFDVTLWLHALDPGITLSDKVGRDAEFRLASGYRHVRGIGARSWQGVCAAFEQVEARPDGRSSYVMHIVPRLWLLGRRRNSRIFQHLSIPHIVEQLLSSWQIEHRWSIDQASYPVLNYRVQYEETDLAFVQRLLGEAGISFYFLDDTPHAAESLEDLSARTFDAAAGSIMVLTDMPQAAELRGPPIAFTDNLAAASAAEQEHVAEVLFGAATRPGKVSYRDYDFRLRPDYPLLATVTAGADERYEQYAYLPGGFRREGIGPAGVPHANDKAVVGTDEAYGRSRAELSLLAARTSRRRVQLVTNTTDLSPGRVFAIEHPHPGLQEHPLLALEQHLSGEAQAAWTMAVQACFASERYVPSQQTPRPHIQGVQSALVVGPPGEEIHTDEYGRVRVQFHWDREGQRDDNSSCWLRVSQGWAGTGYGMLNLPRVGHEVLVAFEGGDPDRPLVVGRVFNGLSVPPYKLPEHRTKSVWRSCTTPGGDGFNEISMDDAAGRELVYIQAQRNLDRLVKNDETELTMGNRKHTVVGDTHITCRQSVRRLVGQDSHGTIEGSRHELIGGNASHTVMQTRHTRIGVRDALEVGKEIHVRAGQQVVVEAGARITVRGPGGFIDIHADGVDICGKLVRINSGGSPAAGAGAQPQPPLPAEPAVPVDPAAQG